MAAHRKRGKHRIEKNGPNNDLWLGPKEEGRLDLADLIREVGDVCELPYKRAREIVYAIFLTMIKKLRAGEEVKITNFGKWFVKEYPEHTMWRGGYVKRHVTIPKKTVVRFKPSQRLSYMVDPDRFH